MLETLNLALIVFGVFGCFVGSCLFLFLKKKNHL